MIETRYRPSARVLTCLIIAPLAALLIAGGFSPVAAEDADTTGHPDQRRLAVEIEIGNEGVTVRTSAEEKKKRAEISAGITIDDEGITVNGVCVEALDLADSVLKCITVEGGSIVKFGEDTIIEEDEIVDGDLVSFGGNVTVRGTVTGDVAVIGGDLYLKSTGTIKGDVTTLGGKLHQEPGAEIRGQRVGVLPLHFRTKLPLLITHPFRSFVSFGIPLVLFIILSLSLAFLVVFFAPRNVERVRETIESAPLKSVLLGFGAAILFMPLFVLLCITIIGIPVALIIQPIAYSVASIMGFAGVSLFVGAKLDQRTGLTLPSPLAKILVGALAIELAFILAWIFTLGGGILAPLFWLFQTIGWIIISLAGLAGLGAVVWTRFGKRSVVTAAVVAHQAPPPSPPENAGEKETPGTPASGQ